METFCHLMKGRCLRWAGPDLTHPLRIMTIMAPRRRMRTASPPAQIPRISPISSDLCDTSRGLLLSLQAAEETKAGQRIRRKRGIN